MMMSAVSFCFASVGGDFCIFLAPNLRGRSVDHHQFGTCSMLTLVYKITSKYSAAPKRPNFAQRRSLIPNISGKETRWEARWCTGTVVGRRTCDREVAKFDSRPVHCRVAYRLTQPSIPLG